MDVLLVFHLRSCSSCTLRVNVRTNSAAAESVGVHAIASDSFALSQLRSVHNLRNDCMKSLEVLVTITHMMLNIECQNVTGIWSPFRKSGERLLQLTCCVRVVLPEPSIWKALCTLTMSPYSLLSLSLASSTVTKPLVLLFLTVELGLVRMRAARLEISESIILFLKV